MSQIAQTAPAKAALRRHWRLPLVAALALAFVSLSLISGIAYIVVLAGATGTTFSETSQTTPNVPIEPASTRETS